MEQRGDIERNKKEKISHTARMKTIKLKSSILASFISLLLLFPWMGAWKTSTLKDITKPYLGVYECREARLDDTDYLQSFDYIRLELKNKNRFLLSYKAKGEKGQEEKGRYAYDKENKTIAFQADAMPFIKRQFPLKDGELLITASLGDKTLHMRFIQL